MDIGSLQRQLEDGRNKLTDASHRRATGSEQLFGVMRHVEESVKVTWQSPQENVTQHRALMEQYRQLSHLLVSVSNALGEGRPVKGGQRMGDQDKIDLEAFQTAFNQAHNHGHSSNGQEEPAYPAE